MASPTSRVQKNQVLELPVTSLAFGGKGIARVSEKPGGAPSSTPGAVKGSEPGDFVVFVTGAVPGDVVRARVTKNKKRYAEARVEELVVPSPDRRPARCPSSGECGGCTWQTLDYGKQLEYKASQVKESLEHLGGLHDFEMLPIVGMADPWRYRNRADFSIGNEEDGAVIGFRPPGRWDSVLPLTECHLLGPAIERIRTTVETWLRDNGLPGWDPRSGTGYARHLLVRSARRSQEVLVSLVTAPGAPPGTPGTLPGASSFVDCLRSTHPEVVGVLHAVNGGRAEISAGLPSKVLWGRPYLLEGVAGITLKVSIDAFFQTNTVMAHALYELAAREVGLRCGETATATGARPGAPGFERTAPGSEGAAAGSEGAAAGPVIWDLYSGVGSIGLSLAGQAKAILGIEGIPAAVEDARRNARLNGIDNAEFIEGDVAKMLREVADGERRLPEQLERPDVIVVDPPRAGLAKKAISRIGEVGAPRIVYVSCNPATMAPNAAEFATFGYRLERVTPVDMFPHTPHVEAVALLIRE